MQKNKISLADLINRPDSKIIDVSINIITIAIFLYIYTYNTNHNWFVLLLWIWLLVIFFMAIIRLVFDKLWSSILANLIFIYILTFFLITYTSYWVINNYLQYKYQIKKETSTLTRNFDKISTWNYMIKFRKPIIITYWKNKKLINWFYFYIENEKDKKYLKIFINKPDVIYWFKNIDIDPSQLKILKKNIKKSLLIKYNYVKTP